MITCAFENQTKKVHLRHVVVDALAVKGGKILLIKRADEFSGANLWALPGGFLDTNETITHAVLREFTEETGYAGQSAQLFRIVDSFDRPGENQQNISFIYLITVGKKIGAHDHEASEIRWFNFNALPPVNQIAFDHYQIIKAYQLLSNSSNCTHQDIFLF